MIDTNRFVCGNPRHILSGFFIVAMPVIDPFVAPLVLSAKGYRDNMIDFEQIAVTKGESTSWALSLLDLKELGLFVVHEWMLFQPFCPIQEVSIVGACVSLDQYVVLMMRIRMAYHIHRLGFPLFILEGGSKPIAFIDSDEVLFFHPLLAFLRVSCVSPSFQLKKGDVIAGRECLRANHPSMVEAPPSNEGIEVTDDSLLWSVSLLPQHLPDLLGVALDGFLTGCDDRFEA